MSTIDRNYRPFSSNSIELAVTNTSALFLAYDRNALVLYVSLHQVFRIFLLPSFFAAPVHLTTVLHLTPATSWSPTSHSESQHTTYLIQSQNDLYQVNEFFKFFSLLRVLWIGVLVWQFLSTLACVLGQWIFWPISQWEEGRVGRNLETRSEVEANARKDNSEVGKLD